MTIAHVGHPAELASYLAPIVVIGAWLTITRWRDRRRARSEEPRHLHRADE